ncbi:MAG: uridylate kinase [Methylococcaceae bacterium]
MRIIKLGGSLLHAQTLLHCLNRIEKQYSENTVIVSGGGIFADQVRLTQQQWGFDDTTAHEMALLAMQQMALLFKGLKPNFALAHQSESILKLLAGQAHTPVIWSPDIAELNRAAIAPTWQITSDSLAAWLAKSLSARQLILVKSTPINPRLTLQELINQGIIDEAFSDFVAHAPFTLAIYNSENF